MKQLAVTLLLVAMCGCAPTVEPPASPKEMNASKSEVAAPPVAEKPRFDLKTLFYAAPAEVEKVFGPSTGGNIIKEPYTDQMPGEFRDYSYSPENKYVLVRFFNDQCVMIQMELPKRYDEALDALASVGIDASSVSPRIVAPAATRWTAKIGGVLFKDLAAINSSIDGSRGFDMVQFELPQP